jgi:hypothetical protein
VKTIFGYDPIRTTPIDPFNLRAVNHLQLNELYRGFEFLFAPPSSLSLHDHFSKHMRKARHSPQFSGFPKQTGLEKVTLPLRDCAHVPVFL